MNGQTLQFYREGRAIGRPADVALSLARTRDRWERACQLEGRRPRGVRKAIARERKRRKAERRERKRLEELGSYPRDDHHYDMGPIGPHN